METKLSKLKAAASSGDWAGALRIAAKFPQLGEHKTVIVRAHECFVNPAFYRQLGRDPEACIEAGISALRIRYRL
jgi:hypothetical protein